MFGKKKEKSVAEIMSTFTDTITSLEKLAGEQGEALFDSKEIIAKEEAKMEAAIIERDKAIAFAENLGALLEG